MNTNEAKRVLGIIGSQDCSVQSEALKTINAINADSLAVQGWKK